MELFNETYYKIKKVNKNTKNDTTTLKGLKERNEQKGIENKMNVVSIDDGKYDLRYCEEVWWRWHSIWSINFLGFKLLFHN